MVWRRNKNPGTSNRVQAGFLSGLSSIGYGAGLLTVYDRDRNARINCISLCPLWGYRVETNIWFGEPFRRYGIVLERSTKQVLFAEAPKTMR